MVVSNKTIEAITEWLLSATIARERQKVEAELSLTGRNREDLATRNRKIYEARIERGVSAKQVAKDFGLSENRIHSIAFAQLARTRYDRPQIRRAAGECESRGSPNTIAL